jgi:4-hydroxy-2-oxoheptanedioate aldolase
MRATRQSKAEPAKTKAAERVRLGGWLAIPEPLVVEVAGRAGYDWVGLDLQHGAWDLGTAFRGIQLLDLLGVPILVRVSEEDLALIPRVLDQGAAGIVVAMASSPAIVAAAIDRARYAPHGHRSYGGQRFGMRAEPHDLATVRPAIYAMLEDRRGVEAAAEIARVPGLAGLHIGPVDLGLGLGLGRDRAQPAFTAALQAILAAGHAERLPVVMHAVKPDQVAHWVEMGFDELVLTADIEVLRLGFEGQLATAREAIGARPRPVSAVVGPYGQARRPRPGRTKKR